MITLFNQLCTGLALMFMLEGFAWIDTGYGIHPLFAGPAATVLVLLPHFIRWVYRD